MEIKTTGRTDIKDLVRLSPLFKGFKLNHTPFLVFETKNDVVSVVIVDSQEDLLKYPDNTKVMAQWVGKFRSDYFQFTVGEIRRLL